MTSKDGLAMLYKEDIRNAYRALEGQVSLAVEAALDLGSRLMQAKDSLPYDVFRRMFQGEPDSLEDPLPMSLQWANRIIKISNHPAIRGNIARLPKSLGALSYLSSLSAPDLLDALNSEKITSESTYAEAAVVARSYNGSDETRLGVQLITDDTFVLRFRTNLNVKLLRSRKRGEACHKKTVEMIIELAHREAREMEKEQNP